MKIDPEKWRNEFRSWSLQPMTDEEVDEILGPPPSQEEVDLFEQLIVAMLRAEQKHQRNGTAPKLKVVDGGKKDDPEPSPLAE